MGRESSRETLVARALDILKAIVSYTNREDANLFLAEELKRLREETILECDENLEKLAERFERAVKEAYEKGKSEEFERMSNHCDASCEDAIQFERKRCATIAETGMFSGTPEEVGESISNAILGKPV